MDLDGIEFDLGGIQGRFGKQLNPNVAIEGRIGFGVQPDSVGFSAGGDSVSLEIDPELLLGAYLKLGMGASQPLSPYVLVGHFTVTAETRFSLISGGMSASGEEDESVSDPSYGVGLDVNLDRKNLINLEWLMLDDDDDTETTTINIGYVRRF